MRLRTTSSYAGFSLVELVTAMALTAFILGVGVAAFSGAIGTRMRQNSRSDALTTGQAALNIMSREIANSGYGLTTNGLVLADCTSQRIHFRANVNNRGSAFTDTAGEDMTFYYDSTSQSVVRYDSGAAAANKTSGLLNQVGNVDFTYYNYTYDGITNTTSVSAPQSTCSANTGRVAIALSLTLPDVQGQPSGRVERLTSEITLRNSPVMLQQY